METRKQLLMTGLFLVIGVAVALITILMLGGDRRLFSKSATMSVKFDQVQGLNHGAVVSLAGLPVGNVDAFDFDPKTNMIKVSMKLKMEEFIKLTEGTQAEIRTQGALGDKYIYIIPGPTGGTRLKDGLEIPAAKSTDLMAILSEKGTETEKIFDIISEMYILMKTINQDNKMGNIMSNLERGTASLSKVANTAETSMTKFDRVMTRIDKGEGTLGALISDSAIHDQIKSILGGSQRKSQVRDMLKRSVEK